MIAQLNSLRNLLVVAFLFSLNHVFAQFNHYNTEKEIWNQGEVYLNSGEVLVGLVNYNFVTDQVRVDQNGDIQTFLPQRVSSFILDDTLGNLAQYVSLPFDLKNTGKKVPSFFLMVYRNSEYAVLSKYVITYAGGDFGGATAGIGNASFKSPLDQVTEYVSQQIFLADKSARIEVCLDKSISTFMSVFWDSKAEEYSGNTLAKSVRYREVEKFNIPDKEAFQSFFREDYPTFSRYVKDQDLDLHYIADLITALDFKEF